MTRASSPQPARPGSGDTPAAEPRERQWIGWMWAWVLVAAAAMAFDLGGHALFDPDEGETAAVALEMATTGDFIVPRLNALPRLDKPVLAYAFQAFAMRVLGPSELAARLPALLAAWATMALTAWFSARLFGRSTAWIAALVVATSPLAVAMGRTARGDSLLAFFMVLAVVGFYRAVENEPQPGALRCNRWTLIAWAAMGAGVLTKGPVALAIPLLVAGPYALWRRRSLAVWHPAGWALHLLVVLPWAFAVEGRIPGFLHYALVTETWQRLTTDELQRTGPVWYFLPYLLAGCFPWIVMVGATALLRRGRGWGRWHRPLVFVLLWLSLPLLFFSLSQSKRPHYILPLVPAVALLAAWAWNRRRPPVGAARTAALAWVLLGGTLLLAAWLGLASRLPDSLAGVAQPTVWALGGLAVAAGLLAFGYARRRALAPVALSLPLVALPAVTAPLLHAVAKERSARALVAAIEPHLASDTAVVGIETFTPSLAFYLRRPIRVSTATGEPLGSNYVLGNFEALIATGSPSLCPAGCWWDELRRCARPTIFLLEPQYSEVATLSAAGLPILFENSKLVAMGPCRPL